MGRAAPAISVIMSVYNAEKYLSCSIESILCQTFGDFEFIIVNDGSIDGTIGVIRKYCEREPRIILVDRPDNIGLTKSLNEAIGISRGGYIARMDADDVSLPDRLREQGLVLSSDPGVGLVSCLCEVIGPDGEVESVRDSVKTDSEIRKGLLLANPIVHSSVMVRASILRGVGAYDPVYRYSQDKDLWFRIGMESRFRVIPKVLHRYRNSEENITSKKRKYQKLYAFKATCNAFSLGFYRKRYMVFLAWPLLGLLLPQALINWCRSIYRWRCS